MEFTCVLSVNGSLAAYQVRNEGESRYTATLRTVRTDIPSQLVLEKVDGAWTCTPAHDYLCTSLAHAIDAGNGPAPGQTV